MRFYGGFRYKSPSKRRGDRLRKENFLAKFKRDPLLVPIPFLEPDQSPSPVTLGGPICATTAFTTQAEELVDEIRRLCHWQNCLSQEAGDTEKERDKMSNWVCDLFDQRADVRDDFWKLEHDLKSKRVELEQLKVEASGLSNTGPAVTSSVQCLYY